MVAFVLERTPVTSGLLTMLRSWLVGKGASGRDLKIEIGETPRDPFVDAQNKLVDPYAVIYPWPSLRSYGDLAHPESGATLSYQITSVGRTDESAGFMSDLIRRGILERLDSGSFTRALAAGASMTVTGRWVREVGMLTSEAGLWNVHDLYDLEVQAHA
jgi:hypothetical protein